MDKNKSFYLTLVVVFCVVLSGLGGYFIGTHFGEKETIKNEVKKDEEKKNEEINANDIKVADLSNYVYTALYSYLKSGEKSLNSYLNNLSNDQKLYVAGLLNFEDEDNKYNNKKYSDLKNKLIDVFGTDLNLQAKDYYTLADDKEPLFIYNKETDEFVYNENTIGTDVLVDFDLGYIYNYKLKDKNIENDELVITYYGLYAYQDEIGPTTLSNDKNIERILNYEEESNGMTDEEYLEKAFSNNKDDFFKFSYIYKKINDKDVLVDFKQA